MLMWITQNETRIPDKVRQNVLKLLNQGYSINRGMRPSGRMMADRCHAVAIIERNNRYDLYPFNRESIHAFLRVTEYTERHGGIAGFDDHTEGYPVFEPDMDLREWLDRLYCLGLIDAYVIKEREQLDILDIIEEGYRGYHLYAESKYKLYFIHNKTIYPIEWWLANREEIIPLEEAHYNHERYRYVRVLDVGRLVPEVRKMMRRSTTSWLRALVRK